jgi:hypothetical protein
MPPAQKPKRKPEVMSDRVFFGVVLLAFLVFLAAVALVFYLASG